MLEAVAHGLNEVEPNRVYPLDAWRSNGHQAYCRCPQYNALPTTPAIIPPSPHSQAPQGPPMPPLGYSAKKPGNKAAVLAGAFCGIGADALGVQRCKPRGLAYNYGVFFPLSVLSVEEEFMNRQWLPLAVAGLVIGSCIVARAAEPSANNTDNPFAGKIVRVSMAGETKNEVFMLEHVKLVTVSGSELFLVGTGIQNSSARRSWDEGLEVHLNLRFVTSYCPMTPEQWKDKQRSMPTRSPERPEGSATPSTGRR